MAPGLKLVIVTGTLGVLCGLAYADDEVTKTPPNNVRCEEAVVNPVTGFAECVKPRGAPVDPPPARPAPTQDECAKHADLNLDACKEPKAEKGH